MKVQQGVVVWKSAGLDDGCPPYAPIHRWVEAIETTFLYEGVFRARARTDETGSYTSVVVDLKPAATEDQRRRAFAFNLGCLSKIGGCHDVRQMLPLITPGEH